MGELWYGFEKKEFTFEGRRAVLVFPKQADAEKNWTLKTEYWDAFPEVETALLENGFHAAYLENTSRFATPADCDAKARFADFLQQEYGLNPKCVPVGMSCGGACAVNFAGRYPEKVRCMYLDAPVLNFCDYPGRLGNAECESVWEKEFVKAYPGITRARLLSFDNHPLHYVDVLKEHRIPILMLYGVEDQTVFYHANGALMEPEYEDCKELLTVLPRMAQGHHPHGGFAKDQQAVVDFILRHSK